MEWLNDLIKKNPFAALFLPTGLGGLTFFGNLFIALSDGNLDGYELHQLLSSASGLETFLLVIIMVALRNDKTNNVKKK